MKRIAQILGLLAWAVMVMSVGNVEAQGVVIGARAPKLPKCEWLTDAPQLKGKALLLEFFHSANSACRERVEVVNQLANKYEESINVVIVAREPREQITALLLHEYQHNYIALDEDGAIFGAFEVRYIPYSVLIDERGTVLWTGNSTLLDHSVIDKFITTK